MFDAKALWWPGSSPSTTNISPSVASQSKSIARNAILKLQCNGKTFEVPLTPCERPLDKVASEAIRNQSATKAHQQRFEWNRWNLKINNARGELKTTFESTYRAKCWSPMDTLRIFLAKFDWTHWHGLSLKKVWREHYFIWKIFCRLVVVMGPAKYILSKGRSYDASTGLCYWDQFYLWVKKAKSRSLMVRRLR